MRYNPCGRYTEMMRRPYQIPCRFLRDSELTSTLRWVEARDDALPLDRTSVIESEDWSNDRGMWPDRIGEQDGRRVFRAASAPIGSGRGHVCGTDQDFNEGGLYAPNLPPVLYDALGWPLCCAGARRIRGGAGASGQTAVTIRRRINYGGAGASGRAVVTVRRRVRLYGGAGASGRSVVSRGLPISLRGGAGGGGRAEVTPVAPIAMRGGGGGGGRSTVAFAPVCPGMGPTCVAAVLDDVGHWCWFEIVFKTDKWRKWNTEPGGTYRFEMIVATEGGQTWDLYSGDVCEFKTLITHGTFHAHYQVIDFVAVGTVAWWRLGGTLPGQFPTGATRLTRLY